MPNRRAALSVLLLGFLLVVTFASCGSDDAADDGRDAGAANFETELKVTGIATTADAPPSSDPQQPLPPVPEPGTVTKVPFSGTLRCGDDVAAVTGMFADDATATCQAVKAKQATFTEITKNDHGACAEIYGGPQHARIKGVVDGKRVNVTVTRNNGCGIDDWDRLEWLLGPPER